MFKDGAKDFRWGETRNKKYYVNHDKFKTVNPGSDYENEILFGESLHSLKEIAPERYEKIYNSAINDPDMKRRLKEAQVFEKEQHRDFNEYVRNTRLDQIIGGNDVIDWGGEVKIIPLTPGYSTSKIIKKIKIQGLV